MNNAYLLLLMALIALVSLAIWYYFFTEKGFYSRNPKAKFMEDEMKKAYKNGENIDEAMVKAFEQFEQKRNKD